MGAKGRGGRFRRDKHFPHHDRFADGFATARDAEAEPDAEGREEDGNERAVELDGVLDDDEAVFGVLEGGDEEAADETEDEDVALHDGVVKKYILAYPERRRASMLGEQFSIGNACPRIQTFITVAEDTVFGLYRLDIESGTVRS